MSGIWGYINLRENAIHSSVVEHMKESLSFYRVDRVDVANKDNYYFVCGHQYITEEAVSDKSPIVDEERGICFLGDCFLNNREKVIRHLVEFPECSGFSKGVKLDSLGDCQLAYLAYLLIGEKFVSFLRGSFAFAIYHVNDKKLHLYSDHLAKRYLAYYICEDFVCFGSTYKPIKGWLGERLTLNERFIANAYRTMAPQMFYYPSETVYENVFHVDNATHIEINCADQSIRKENYWNPKKTVKRIKNKTDEEYKEIFLNSYRDIVASLLRSRKETGIMLSGGLDSSSVAAFAAPELAKKGKKLFTYTSVPALDYTCTENTWMVEDETELVKAQCKLHENMEPRFVSGGNEDCLSETEVSYEFFDIPVKPSINHINIDNMGRAALADQCSILLGAANGNPTVSYGSIGQYISISLLSGHPIRAFKEMSAYCRRYKLSRFKYFRNWCKVVWKTLTTDPEVFTYFLSEKMLKKYGLESYEKDEKMMFGTDYVISMEQKNNFVYIPMQYIQRGFFHTNQGLKHGYLQIDPTMTAEMVELCLSLPMECFVHDGVERRLVNGYMKDLLPPVITDVNKGFGRQAADCAFRVNRNWEQIRTFIYDILSEPHLRDYLDDKELNELIKTIQNNEYNLDRNTVVYTTLISSLGYFLRDYYETVNKEEKL